MVLEDRELGSLAHNGCIMCPKEVCCFSEVNVEGGGDLGTVFLICREGSSRDFERSASLNRWLECRLYRPARQQILHFVS